MGPAIDFESGFMVGVFLVSFVECFFGRPVPLVDAIILKKIFPR